MGEKWMIWTLLEAGTKTSSKLLQKVVGNVSSTLAHVFFATFVVGIVQVVAGFIMVKSRGKKFFPNAMNVLGSCLFGFFAVASTVLALTVFLLGGDVGVNTFIITLSIVPGAMIDKVFFGHPLNSRQWLGVAVAILAGYSILGWPSLSHFLGLPLWVWLSFCNMMTVAINQGITQRIKDVDPFVKNFWGGATTVILCALGIIALGHSGLFVNFSDQMQKLWLVSAVIGGIVVGMWSFNLLSYKGGASIAIKKLVMNGSYLTSAMLLAIPIFGESLTVGKIVGVLLFLGAFTLMDKGTWKFICSLVIQREVSPIAQ